MSFAEFLQDQQRRLRIEYMLHRWFPGRFTPAPPDPRALLDDDEMADLKERLRAYMPLDSMIVTLWDWDVQFEDELSDNWFLRAALGDDDTTEECAEELADFFLAMVDQYGITGPNQRAAGFVRDLRRDAPYLVYDQLEFDVITATESDAYARSWVRYQEMHQGIRMLRQCLERTPREGPFQARMPNVLHWEVPAGETYVKAECMRGEYGYYMVTDGSEYVRRVHVRGPSYTHAIALMEKLAVGTNIADTAGLMVSLHTYPPEIER